MKIALVAIGYNRKNGFQRLVESLINAEYAGDKVDLILSIDNSGVQDVVDYANSVSWEYGEKIVKTYPERQGLRNHILQCGDFLNDYDAIAVFEDDILVSPGFYNFTKQAVEKYCNNSEVAGISLYSFRFNQYCNYSFSPDYSDYDAFFIQVAQSWGQVWMKKQWFDFIAWYKQQSNDFIVDDSLPEKIRLWGSNSWLKYHIKYCVENKKFFVFPYMSQTTCFSDVGEHYLSQSNAFQVELCKTKNKEYYLPDIYCNDAVFYDVFFERIGSLSDHLNIAQDDLIVDLYGTKKCDMEGNIRYVLSSKKLPYRIVKSYGRIMRPHEQNILYDVPGNDFFLYDTSVVSKRKHDKSRDIRMYVYYNNVFSNTKILCMTALHKLFEQAFMKLRK